MQWVQGTLCFSGQATSCSKLLKDKKYVKTVKSFRATLFFRARKLFKHLNDKISVTGRQRRQGQGCQIFSEAYGQNLIKRSFSLRFNILHTVCQNLGCWKICENMPNFTNIPQTKNVCANHIQNCQILKICPKNMPGGNTGQGREFLPEHNHEMCKTN